VNHTQIAVTLGSGTHRVALVYRPRGASSGLAIAALAASAAALAAAAGRRV
jgi:hypothetical protein